MALTNNGHSLANLWTSSYYTLATPVTFNVDTRITGLGFYAATGYGGVTSDVRARLWSSSMTSLASSNLVSVTLRDDPYSILPTIAKFTTPYVCTAGTIYYIGGYQRYASYLTGQADHDTHSVGLVAGTIIYGRSGSYPARYESNTDTTTLSGSASGYEFQFALEFNTLPNAPTAVSVAANVPTTANPVLSWTHNDPQSEAQAGYQIRWRKL